MIKLGNAYFDPAAIEAICPNADKLPGNYIIILASGRFADVRSDPKTLESVLIAAGLLPAPDADEPEGIPLTEAQRHELASLYRSGFQYIAKDMNGCCYAYVERPTKHGAYWDPILGDTHPQRLTEDYDFLDFEDATPAAIPVVLGVPVPPAPLFTPDPEAQ